MDINDALDYLKTWAKVNAEEVCGSPREYVKSWELEYEINQLKRIMEGR